jgi:predicted glycogen debranching enzyme
MIVDLPRALCGELEPAERREWLVTNGLGGYASGTVAGLPTRRYHGLLVAAQSPPDGRAVLVSKFDEEVTYRDEVYELSATRWRDGTIAPAGYRYIERFCLEGAVPVWTFACADVLLEKRVWMEQGENTTYVTYTLVRASGDVQLRIKALCEGRDHHAFAHARAERTDVERVESGVRCAPPGGIPPFYIRSNAAVVRDTHEWYLGVLFARERDRGFDYLGDQLHVGNFTFNIAVGHTAAFTLSTRADAPVDPHGAWERQVKGADEVQRRFAATCGPPDGRAPAWTRQIVAAADQFVAQRPLPGGTHIPAIIAGYPWFGAWGRDTMISLPGLLLRTGRVADACALLRAWAALEHEGLLPNVFVDAGATPQYNTVDASLLFIEAARRTIAGGGDAALGTDLFPAIERILRAYRDGTSYGIGMDPADGLIHAGEPGVALTWMDARIDGVPVTQRAGKPVEINALWYNALHVAAELAPAAGGDPAPYLALAERAGAGFQRYWDASEGHLFDVLDGPNGNDLSLRPNQLFAVALEHRALSPDKQRAIFDACARALLTSSGLRTLATASAAYRGTYGGPSRDRDGAYHEGTVWPWLIGPFAAAALNVGIDRATVESYLEPFGRTLTAYGLGTLSEIADGDPPHAPNGCIAQAWSVGAVLDAWAALSRSDGGSPAPPSRG